MARPVRSSSWMARELSLINVNVRPDLTSHEELATAPQRHPVGSVFFA
ncbi:MAG: hypothetical protein ABI630_02230 [Betaproteobacteria bacterium]